MRDLTHYFSDSFKASETPPAESKEVSDKSPTVAEVNQVNTKSKKTNSVPKKRGRKKKIASPDSDNSKKTKCDLGIEKIKPLANGRKDSCIKEIPDVEGSPENISEENLNEKSSDNSNLDKSESNEPLKNEEQLPDGVSNDKSGVSIVQDEGKEENLQNGAPVENVDIDTSDQSFEKVEPETISETQDDQKKKRKAKVKILAEKKGYAKRKLKEEEEAEEMEKKLQERKNAFTNVPKKDENQPEIVHKPPAYSLLNYFSKATPEQRQKEEAAKCKMSVKVEVHTPKEVSPNSTPNTTPKSQSSASSQNKKKRAEIKQALSTMDEIQLISSESVSESVNVSPPPVLQEKKKPNKPKWRIQFHSESFTDCGSDGELFSPKSASKMQKENRKSAEIVNGNAAILNGKENPSKSENSETEAPKLQRKDRAAKHKAKMKFQEKSDTDEEFIEKEVVTKRKRKGKSDAEEECTENKGKKKVSQKETKNSDSKVDVKKELDSEVIIIEETLPKRSAPEKIAPLFIKKRKLDPAVLEARRLFLQSDLSENENRPAKRKPSPVRNPVLPFPQISHVTQLDSDPNSETGELKVQLKIQPCKFCPSKDVSEFKKITNVNDSFSKRWLKILDPTKSADVEEALSEFESKCEDARAMWKSISQTAKPKSPKQSTRTSKRRGAAKKIVKTEETKSIDDHDNVWIFKYKPMSTQEIVGNEQAAGKLKTWLDKWKTPVKDDGNSDDDFYASDCSSNYSSSDFNQVAVLLGPHGCGKTASVYAVAEELGYSVLEINASSRRTGKRIFKELEEATKSHRIKKSDMKQTFLKAQTEEKKIPQNSLILMEDVDIIFEEDEGFVSAAFQLASNTKRPIVMTCNESCSHLNKLAPQQLHIQFQATTGNRPLVLLELISLAETGRKLSTSCVENLLESGDLRKALLQLQFLLATGETHVLPPINANNRVGISFWRKAYQCLYKPAVKSSKKQKKKTASKDSDTRDVDILSQLADDLERVSLISKLIGVDDVSWTCRNSKTVMSLSLSEDTRPYSYSETISSDIAEFLTYEVIQKKEDSDSEQISDQVSSKLITRRKVNDGINSFLSHIVSSTTDNRIISVDYLPSVRTICRSEETRIFSNNKRGNRFFHYLHGSKLPTNSLNILSAACKIMQEKPDKV